MTNCGICLDKPESPVSIPCGHVHCEKCLGLHISAGTDAMQSICPICRAPFYIAPLNPTYVPKKYHPFLLPSIRRLHVDLRFDDELDALQSKVDYLEESNAQLMEECEAHVEAEAQARLEARNAEAKLEHLLKKYKNMKKEYLNATASATDLANDHSNTSLEKYKPDNGGNQSISHQHSNALHISGTNSTDGREKSRPKRALPKSRQSIPELSPQSTDINSLDPPPHFRKRPRLGQC
ncbi:hypothetical protein BJ138DRAFT_1077657 [Hygrophoropsis aurantiaca]|uniref:Uncharacterized protein n=1 Tax=Hygrophoropsis aurantiaca TaxID=72124 RepID=A0ACB8AR47_9AGAM|nr:hypothetical protein BJ138DRAFT_1077657 [Hygrophoropsis aurantiaca]